MTQPILPDYTLVAGAGVSGLGAAQLLERAGARFTVVDDSEAGRARAAASGYDACTGDEARTRFGEVGLSLKYVSARIERAPHTAQAS